MLPKKLFPTLQTLSITAIEQAITEAVTALGLGKLVLFPTETVWGIGALSNNPTALAKIYQLKRRDFNKALMPHIANLNDLKYITKITAITDYWLNIWGGHPTLKNPLTKKTEQVAVTDTAQAVTKQENYQKNFNQHACVRHDATLLTALALILPYLPPQDITRIWPMPDVALTKEIINGKPITTIGIRIPQQIITQIFLRKVQTTYHCPLLATSANLSNQKIASQEINDYLEEFFQLACQQELLGAVLPIGASMGGVAPSGVASTIISLVTNPPKILRHGEKTKLLENSIIENFNDGMG